MMMPSLFTENLFDDFFDEMDKDFFGKKNPLYGKHGRNMMKTDLVRAAKISTNAMAKLGRNGDVRVGVLVKICSYLGCTIDDVMDIIPEE